jgi:quercetin dioxygenase-like cupin family protein
MLTVNTTTLDLFECWLGSDPDHTRVRVNFPLNRAAGTQGGAVVYFEVRPGERLGRHTDSPEEILYIVQGTAEAEVGDERGIVRAGELALIPAMVPHGLRNIGDETVKVVGFFSEPDVTSSFEEPVQPMGQAVMEQAPIPVAA